MNLLVLDQSPTLENALEIIDALRRDVIEGKCIAFVAAGITPDDGTMAYMSSSRPVSRLRVMGALANLQHAFIAGEEI